uniref:Uncharacterized protein n=1 Tax=Caenorhabditis japonica TaxID=281687 RepID=A0A8R1ISI4_CAEJA
MGCYVSCAKTLQIWNDLDRHQQKKLKSERMQLVKLSSTVTAMERSEGYLLIGFADDRVSIYEEKGAGSIELVGSVEKWHEGLGLTDRNVLIIRTRSSKTSNGSRLFIHSLTAHHIVIHTVLIADGKIDQHECIVAHEHSMTSPVGFEFVSYKYFEFLVFGRGISNEKLSVEDRKRMDAFRDFEFV